jgi:hypothetical protein
VKIRFTTWIRIALAGILSIASLELIAHCLPSRINDVLALPGGVAGMFGELIGLYDIPSSNWAIACIAGNFLFYAALWWALISLAWRRLTIGWSDHGATTSMSQGEGR